jgi:membrane protein DedA with SNARE-associated domain
MYGGRPVIEKYGRYVLLSRHDLDIADRWFANHGEAIVFVSRLLPAIRTFIAFPAGVARMNLKRFIIYTFAGSLPWCLGLAYIGQKLGEQWNKDDTLKTWFHRFDFVIGIVGALAVGWWIWRHVKHSRAETAS